MTTMDIAKLVLTVLVCIPFLIFAFKLFKNLIDTLAKDKER